MSTEDTDRKNASASGASGSGEAGQASGQQVKPERLERAAARPRKRWLDRARKAQPAAAGVQTASETGHHQAQKVEEAAQAPTAAARGGDAPRTAAHASGAGGNVARASATTAWDEGLAGFFGIGLAGLGFLFGMMPYWLSGSPPILGENSSEDVRVLARAVPDPAVPDPDASMSKWTIDGQVISEGKAATDALVYAVIRDQWGNPHGSGPKGVSDGAFSVPIDLIKGPPENPLRAEEVEIVAIVPSDSWFGSSSSEARTILRLEPPAAGVRWRTASATPFLSTLLIFAFSIVVSLWHTGNRIWLGTRYVCSSLLALLFTGAMIYFIGITLHVLSGSTPAQNTVTSLGFAHVYFGKYVDDAEQEWLFSLTTPAVVRPTAAGAASLEGAAQQDRASSAVKQINADEEGPTQRQEVPETGQTGPIALGDDEAPIEDEVGSGRISEGFGAPLWLLLLSVVGASLFMIKLVVENLEKPLEFSPTAVRARVAGMVRHQFYLLFAPLGAIIVYQMLVAAGSASEPITVGLAALASGIALSAVLERAWQAVEAVVKPNHVPAQPAAQQ